MKKTTVCSTKIILILAAIFAPLILASCLYSAVYNLDEDDLAWLPPYKQGDTILFASGTLVDTLVVEETWLYNDHPIFCENEATDIYQAYGGAIFTIIHNGDSISCSYMVERRKENETLVQTRFHRATYNRQKTNIRLHRAIFNGRDYDDLFAIDKSNTSAYKPEYTLIFDRIIWSKSAGLVQYTIDGEKYELQRKI